MGIKFQAKPTPKQKEILSSWMGAAKFVWNAKCEEDKYLRSFAKKYLPLGTYPKPDQQYSQYKNSELSSFLNDCPSQILRNSVSNWYSSYQEFFKRQDRGRPKKKKKGRGMTILLTRELFKIYHDSEGLKLFIGTKRNNIGYLTVNWHDKKWLKYGLPNSIRIKKFPSGEFTVSFCYGEKETRNAEGEDRREWFSFLRKTKSRKELEQMALGIDRGINIACATDEDKFHFKNESIRSLDKYRKRLKNQQKKFAKQKKKDSKRRTKKKIKIAKIHKKISNIRENECHHISKQIVKKDKKIFVLEALPVKSLSKSSKGNAENPGRKVKQKSGLNREILNMAWSKIETQIKYKARREGKVVFKINPAYTSQECADCGHTHSDNRSGIEFKCKLCGHRDHADTNAAKIIKKRAINLLLYSGTELSDKGILRESDTGRGAKIRPKKEKSFKAQVSNCQKRREIVV